MRRWIPVTVLWVLVSVAGGCGPRPVEVSPLIDAPGAYELGFAPQWATRIDVPLGSRLSHVTPLDDLILVVESPGNVVTALRASDGGEAWRRQVADRTVVLQAPFRVGDRVYLTTQSEMVVVDAGNGQEVQRFGLDGFVNHRPALVNNLLIFGGSTGVTFAQRLDNGATVWRTRMNARVSAAPLEVGTGVFVVDEGGGYSLINVADGRLLWNGRAFGPITVDPALGRTHVFVASEDQSLYALERLNGAQSWKYVASRRLTMRPEVIENVLILPEPGGETVAFDPLQGEELWRVFKTMTPVSVDRGRLLALAGRELIRVELDSGQIASSVSVPKLDRVVATSGGVLLVSPEGRLLHLGRR